MTPPVLATALISSSVRLRLTLQVACTPPWLETTGRLAIASTSATAAWLACRSGSNSSECSRMMQRPRQDRPKFFLPYQHVLPARDTSLSRNNRVNTASIFVCNRRDPIQARRHAGDGRGHHPLSAADQGHAARGRAHRGDEERGAEHPCREGARPRLR